MFKCLFVSFVGLGMDTFAFRYLYLYLYQSLSLTHTLIEFGNVSIYVCWNCKYYALLLSTNEIYFLWMLLTSFRSLQCQPGWSHPTSKNTRHFSWDIKAARLKCWLIILVGVFCHLQFMNGESLAVTCSQVVFHVS